MPDSLKSILEVKTCLFLFILSLNLFTGSLLISGVANSGSVDNGGFKYLKNYGPEVYDSQPQNWAIVQGKNDIIYVANQGDLLEFDGLSWRYIDIPQRTVRSLALSGSGTIYVGGVNEIGCFTPDAKGFLRYESLTNHLDSSKRNFGYVWNTHVAAGCIYFHTSNFLFRWTPRTGKMKVWLPQGERFNVAFSCNGEYFIHQRDLGLKRVVGDALEFIPGDEKFAAVKIFFMAPYDNKRLLIGTRSNGFYIYDWNKAVPFLTEADGYLKEKKLCHGIRLSDGDFALSTRQGGVVIIDPRGRLKTIFTKTSGLRDDDVKQVFQDSRRNLWLPLNNGISKIEYASPFSFYDDRSDLTGLVLSVGRHGPGRDLYAGTTSGLYYLTSSGKFRLIPGMARQCWHLFSTGSSLLAATIHGVFQLETGTGKSTGNKGKNITIKKVTAVPAYFLSLSQKDKNRVWVGTREGLISLYRRGSLWTVEHQFENINEVIRNLTEDKEGNLWLGTRTAGTFKIHFPEAGNISGVRISRYGMSHGLPEKEVRVFKTTDRVIFATGKGLHRFDKEKEAFFSDPFLGSEFADDSKNVFRLIEDGRRNIWVHSGNRNIQAVPAAGGAFNLVKQPFLRLPEVQVNQFYPDPKDQFVWFAGNNGLVRYDTNMQKDYDLAFQTHIREVVVNGKPLIYDTEEYQYKTRKGGCWKNEFPVFPYEDRNLRFEFAAPVFEAESRTLYSYFLEGYDAGWSDWTEETWKDYTNLDARRHTFRVRAKNVYEVIGREDSFDFRVLPPWYQAWWAYFIYGFFFVLSVYLIVRWRSWKLVRDKKRLEQEVKERTKEVYDKNILLEEQSEKLKEMDKIKSRFFANISHEFRTPLTLIMGPLEQVLDNSRDKESVENINLALRSSRRLLTLINQLLDLSKLESGRMIFQASRQDVIPFLKGVVGSFESMTAQKKVDLLIQTEHEDITLFYDAEKLEKVMVNLVANAIKFTPAGGKVTVTAAEHPEEEVGIEKTKQKFLEVSEPFSKKAPLRGEALKEEDIGVNVRNHEFNNITGAKRVGAPHPRRRQDYASGYVEIMVCDTGVGIPEDQLPYIFDRFYQAGSATDRGKRGTGIGLALVKELVELHHGEVFVQSVEGKGSEFTLRLPLGKDHLKPEEVAAGPQPVRADGTGIDRMEEIEAEGIPEQEKETGAEDIEEKEEKDVILLVEDNPDVRKFIRGPLQPLYTVVEAANGREGIEKAKKIIPDLIVSDVMMPEVDGYELCAVLKKDVLTSHIPIIMLTAKASDQSVIQGLETGADDYITKPFNTKILLTRIKNLIDLRRGLQEKIQRDMVLQPTEIAVSSVDQEFMKELKKAIEKNMSEEEFGVDDLAKALYMGRATLNRKIRAITGESTNQFIQSYRLKRAAQLLKANFGNVTEVSFEVGFSSSAYFTKCFREKFHQPPHTYLAAEAE